MRNIIAYCVLDFEKCDAYLATINNDQTLREKTAKQGAELNNDRIMPKPINCDGIVLMKLKLYVTFSAIYVSVPIYGDCSDLEKYQTVELLPQTILLH